MRNIINMLICWLKGEHKLRHYGTWEYGNDAIICERCGKEY